MRTSQCVAATARRITTRSIAHAIAPPVTTATTRLAAGGKPSARWAAHATNVDTISISPCAKLSVRVAL